MGEVGRLQPLLSILARVVVGGDERTEEGQEQEDDEDDRTG
jgi:hypothetical protein